MDDVVQNINIEDIIPSNFNPTNEEKRKINELVILIKQFGLLEPMLVRQKNEKYEIILGMEKYQAALIANQNVVPVIVKEIDDETYLNISNNRFVSSKSSKKETFSTKESNTDIINLSELSKIKLEYERDDVKMNNEQLNNEMTNNNFSQPNMNGFNPGPTFGGRFFPSLEDEPTNMNMMGGNGLQQPQVVQPIPSSNPMNNSLIDLTDLSVEKETVSIPELGSQPLTPPAFESTLNNNFNQPQNNFDIPNLGLEPTPMPVNDNIINLNSLQNNNPTVKPVTESVPMDILDADFGAPKAPALEPINQFDMGQVNLNAPSPQNQISSDFGFNQPMMQSQQPQMPPVQPMSNFDMSQSVMPNFEMNQPVVPNFDMNQPVVPNFELPTEISTTNETALKDVTAVTNTIKNLVTSLEAFGYKINVTEEDLTTISKLTIEVEK